RGGFDDAAPVRPAARPAARGGRAGARRAGDQRAGRHVRHVPSTAAVDAGARTGRRRVRLLVGGRHGTSGRAPATRKPSTVTSPRGGPPCSKASGIIELASIVSTAPAANAAA